NAVMSVPAPIDSIGGRLLTSNSLAAGSADIFEPGTGCSSNGLMVCVGSVFFECAVSSAASRLRRDHRLMKFSSSFTCDLRPPAALGGQMLQVGAVHACV